MYEMTELSSQHPVHIVLSSIFWLNEHLLQTQAAHTEPHALSLSLFNSYCEVGKKFDMEKYPFISPCIRQVLCVVSLHTLEIIRIRDLIN